jgi:glycosyltransferase involved in cell wall biosynthesis
MDSDIRVSIIIPVLNSHEVVRRQILHFEKMGLPDDVELIFVDDGSDPVIGIQTTIKNFTLIYTNDFREWTWPLARNKGAKHARGEYLIMADLDHIITKEIIETVRLFTGDFVRFHREFGILDEQGNLSQDRDVLRTYGLPDRYDIKLTPHRNQFAIHKDLYWKMGGFREDRIGRPYPQREDGDFAKLWRQLYEKGEVRDFDDMHGHANRPTIIMFPNGKWCGDVDHNPFGLFHKLTRKTKANRFYKQ